MTAPPAPSPLRRRALAVAASLGAVLAFLLVAEGVVRLLHLGPAGHPEDGEFTARSLDYLEPCYRSSGGDLVETGAGRPPPRRHRVIRRARTPGVARLAVVGESSADLLGQSLDVLLRRSPCGRRFELLQCSIPGSGLEHLERRFDEVMGLSPDVVVVSFGHNLKYLFSTDAARLRARQLRNASRLLSLLGSPFDGPPPATDATFASRLPRFERFLQHAAEETRRRRVATVVTTMASNLWLPPTSPSERGETPALINARYLDATDGPGPAAATLAAETAPLASFERGVLLARAGDPAARASLELALERDPSATRATDALNDAIRRAAARDGMLLRDTVREIESRAPRGLPGWESFRDNCHLRVEAIDRESAAVFALARPALGLPVTCELGTGSEPPSGGDLERFFRQLRGFPPEMLLSWNEAAALQVERRSLDDAAREAREVAGFLASSPPPSPDALIAVAEGLWRAGRLDEARSLNERARTAGSAAAWSQLGLFHLRQHSIAPAREAWQRAAALDPQRADARRYLERLGP